MDSAPAESSSAEGAPADIRAGELGAAARDSAGPAVDVLVACGDVDTRQILGAVLRHAGWRVHEEADPAHAVAAALERRPSLVLTSYPTPAGGGRTVTEALRADGRTAHLPILSVTSRAFPEELARATAAGVTGSLVMPVPPARVADEVRRLLGARGPGRPAVSAR